MSGGLLNGLIPPVPVGDTVVHLFGGPYVTVDGDRVDVPEGSKRLLVFAALNCGPLDRRVVAGLLWPEGDELRASGNLRSALWRLRGAGLDVVDSSKATLRLRAGTVVDVDVVCRWAGQLIQGAADECALAALDTVRDLMDLLPGWYDDWVILERERVRQRLLHALEALSRALNERGRHAEAIEAAIAALGADPLRESALMVLLQAHLGEGNVSEMLRAYEAFRLTLRQELGVEPTTQVREFVADAVAGLRVRASAPLRPAAVLDAVV